MSFCCFSGCSQKHLELVEIDRNTIENEDDIKNIDNAVFDDKNSSDGNGSLMLKVENSTKITLLHKNDIDTKECSLVILMMFRTSDIDAKDNLFLELSTVQLSGLNTTTRSVRKLIEFSPEWAETSITLVPEPEYYPDNFTLQLISNGTGTIWIDDIVVTKSPLRK